jgi:hypothetical protein
VTKVPEQPTQILPIGQPGEVCEECAAPLAVDQRYCLNCGHRRGDARVDYRSVMANGAAAAAGANGVAAGVPPGAPDAAANVASGDSKSPPTGKGERDYAPLAAVGGIAVLGLMLLVGVLIGKGDSSSTSATPQVVRVPAAIGAAAASGAEAEATEVGAAKAKKNASGSGSGGKAEAKSQGLGGGGKEDDSVHEASSGELEELEGESGEDAAKKSLELPNKIATPGAPPPIDKSKPPGGGEGGGLVIK